MDNQQRSVPGALHSTVACITCVVSADMCMRCMQISEGVCCKRRSRHAVVRCPSMLCKKVTPRLELGTGSGEGDAEASLEAWHADLQALLSLLDGRATAATEALAQSVLAH